MPEDTRPVPFRRMIYFGDGTTDIPAMKLVKTQGGYSIAVHDGSPDKRKRPTGYSTKTGLTTLLWLTTLRILSWRAK